MAGLQSEEVASCFTRPPHSPYPYASFVSIQIATKIRNPHAVWRHHHYAVWRCTEDPELGSGWGWLINNLDIGTYRDI